MIKNFHQFIKRHSKKALVLLGSYALILYTIGAVNYPYIDDLGRRIDAKANFIWSYSRYASEFSAIALNGNTRILDMGLVTFLLSSLLLTLTSLIVLYVLWERKNSKIAPLPIEIGWLPFITSILIGINPWFLESLSFRFDNPYMSQAVLFSVLPFLAYRSSLKKFFVFSILGIFGMLNSYQLASGMYIVLLLALIFLDLVEYRENIKTIFQKISLAAIAYLVAIGLYYLLMTLNPELATRDVTRMAPLSQLPFAIRANFVDYLQSIVADLPLLWLGLLWLILFIGLIVFLQNKKEDLVLASIAVTLFFLLSSLFSLGINLVIDQPLASVQPRYMQGAGFLLAIYLLVFDVLNTGYLVKLKRVLTVFFLFYVVSFAFLYANVLDIQKEEFEHQSLMFYQGLSIVSDEPVERVYVNQLFSNSQVYDNAVLTYPILKRLVPNNRQLYWPNFDWYKTLTHHQLDIVPYDVSTTNLNEMEKIKELPQMIIYQNDSQEVYVQMK